MYKTALLDLEHVCHCRKLQPDLMAEICQNFGNFNLLRANRLAAPTADAGTRPFVFR